MYWNIGKTRFNTISNNWFGKFMPIPENQVPMFNVKSISSFAFLIHSDGIECRLHPSNI